MRNLSCFTVLLLAGLLASSSARPARGQIVPPLTVTDTETGRQRMYHNPHGTLASVGDTEAF